MPVLRERRLRLLEGFLRWSDWLAARHGQTRSGPRHLETGRRGEEEAYFYLRRLGDVVVARGWRSGKLAGDLDLVAWEGSTLCFVEVKTRSSRAVATAESAVDEEKMRMLRRMARQYLQTLPSQPAEVRFDVVSIYLEEAGASEIELFRSAFGWF